MKTLKLTLLLTFLFFFISGFSQTSWTGSGDGTSFTDPINWNPNTVPTSGSTIIFDTGGDITVTNIPNSFVQASSLLEITIRNNTHVTFLENTSDISLYVTTLNVEDGSRLALRGNAVISVSVSSGNISGTLDAGDKHNFNSFNTGEYYFENNSKFVTANPAGFSESMQGQYSYTAHLFSILYNGTAAQTTGFTAVPPYPFQKIKINNSAKVTLDQTIETDTLNIADGTFEINNRKLTILGNIAYNGGALSGNLASSVLEINIPAGNTININTPLNLDSLIINNNNNNINATVQLISSNILDVNNLYISSGKLSIGNAELSVENSYFRNTGNGLLEGGPGAKLTFNNLSHQPSGLDYLELYDLKNNSSYSITLENNLIIHNLLVLKSDLNIGSYTLNLGGIYVYDGGVLSVTGNSRINIIYSNLSQPEMTLNFAPGNHINTLSIDRANFTVKTAGSLTVDNLLNISQGKIDILDTLSLTQNATINYSQTSYILTEPGAYLKKSLIAGDTYTVPVGTENYYAPINIMPSSATDCFFAVHDTIYSEGNFGVPFTEKNVNLLWEIEPQTTNTNFDLTLNWDINADAGSFELTNAYISNFDGEEWNVPAITTGTVSAGIATLSRTSVNASGFFGVFSGTNTLPTASANEIYTLKNTNYVFNSGEFNYNDEDGDEFVKIKILQVPDKGTLFIDDNNNDTFDNGENLFQNEQIQVSDIDNGLLKYMPLADEVGVPYTDFKFKVSDGLQYSTDADTMTVNVSNNRPPAAPGEQVFSIPEHSPQGTLVGKIEASDPDGDNVFFYPQEGIVYSDAFKLNDDGTITVDNSSLLEFSLNPSFEYNIDVCDDGQPELCTPVHVIINLEEVVRNLVPANFISPNGDGHNDRWLVKGLDTGVYEAYIFNADGKLLFHSADYKNGWDGTSRGRQLPPGVYYYLLKSPDTELKGTITLVR